MTKKVVPFEPVARRAARERRRPDLAAASVQPGGGADEIGDGVALFQREAAIAWRAPIERHFDGLARLASCRTPAELVTMQATLANEAVCAALADSARLAESWTRLARATARIFESGLR